MRAFFTDIKSIAVEVVRLTPPRAMTLYISSQFVSLIHYSDWEEYYGTL